MADHGFPILELYWVYLKILFLFFEAVNILKITAEKVELV